MRNIIIVSIIIVAIVIGMKFFSSNNTSNKKVSIRIRNESSKDIKYFWLGAGGTSNYSEQYSNIKSGETTAYKSVDAVLAAYRKMNFITTDEKQYMETIYPEKHIGKNELEADASYTFVYTIVEEKPVLKIITERE